MREKKSCKYRGNKNETFNFQVVCLAMWNKQILRKFV